MTKFAITFALIHCILLVAGQEKIKKFVQLNAALISAIEPDSTDFFDLKVIGDAIGDSKIVMLGEQDHGDAPAFLAKTRLIKYLHEQKGFDVIAFESDFLGLNYGWNKIRKDNTSFNSFITENIYAGWAYCSSCSQLLYDYIPSTLNTANPLNVAGFDNQMNFKYILPLLDSLFEESEIPIAIKENYIRQFELLLNYWTGSMKDSSSNNQYITSLTRAKKELLNFFSGDNFLIRVIENMETQYWGYIYRNNYWITRNIRDKQMAINLKWISDIQYPEEKIIVWAHNYHIAKYSGHYPEDFLNAGVSMGTIMANESSLKNKLYHIGFTSYEGSAGRLFPPTNYKIDRPKPNSLENWINKDFNFAFVDFKKFNDNSESISNEFYMSGASQGNNWYHKNSKALWNKIFDGVFFIRHMYPCIKQ